MPVYPYRCNACKREFEITQRMADDDLVKCEVCGEMKLEKLISWASFAGGTTDAALYDVNMPMWSDKGRRPKESDNPDVVPPEQAVADAMARKADEAKKR